MNLLFENLAIGVLILAILYMVLLLWQVYRDSRITAKRFASEQAVFQAEIQAIKAKEDRENTITELTWNGFRKFSVQRKQNEGGDITSFYLVPHDKRPLPKFLPGQYLTFKLNIPGQPKQVIRCYSLSDSPRTDYYRVSIKRVPPPRDKPELPPGLSSNYFHDLVSEGDILDVKAPAGHFYLDIDHNFPVVLIGGGIGLTPVLSMLNHIVESGLKREVWFFYGVRNGDEHVMSEHLDSIASEYDFVKIFTCYSDPRDEQDVLGKHYTNAERVSVELFKKVLPSNNYHYYFCGPPPMMNALFKDLSDWGVPEDHIHYEAFGPATVKKKAETKSSVNESTKSLTVEFAKSSKTVEWNSTEQSLLELAEENDIELEFGCRAGNCGSCVVAIKEGGVNYLSEPGEKPENGSCLACVCTPSTNLILDA